MARARLLLVPLLVLLFFSFAAESRIVRTIVTDLVSDGSEGQGPRYHFLLHPAKSTVAASSCEQTYGFLPCTTTILGNLFLLIVYGYLMFLGARYLSEGSELLLQILGPGIVGGLFLPVLGALPDALLILVSGLSGSKETAQDQVLIGMGLLAGSTVMLLTVLWGSCIVVGKSDFSDATAGTDGRGSKRCDLSGSGVTTDKATSIAARIMVFSVIPFVIVQLPQAINHSSWSSIAIMISLIAAVVMLISYCVYQVVAPWIQKRRLAYAKSKYFSSTILKHLHRRALGRLLDPNGQPDESIIGKLFHLIDEDKDAHISHAELRAFFIGLQFDHIDLRTDAPTLAAIKTMEEFDSSHDNQLDYKEFFEGLSRWLHQAKGVIPFGHGSSNFFDRFHQHAANEVSALGDEGDEATESFDNYPKVLLKAGGLLVLGTVIAAIFADPLVDAVDNFSSATSIPSFFISFIAMPLATNSSEAVSALIFASRKTQRTASLTFSEIYGAVTMNNLLCLAVFLALVYIRGLTWDFTAEVLIILIVVIIMGLFASFRTKFPLWTCYVAYLFYPLSLVLVYVFDYVLGWS
ncbi:sodium/calcium exchanger NCL2-like [Nymphaea colorata]|nr:sodium/calcium exchanger NCL2-like [Nymphaea colorata]